VKTTGNTVMLPVSVRRPPGISLGVNGTTVSGAGPFGLPGFFRVSWGGLVMSVLLRGGLGGAAHPAQPVDIFADPVHRQDAAPVLQHDMNNRPQVVVPVVDRTLYHTLKEEADAASALTGAAAR
jgi:hypothetical protein